MYDCSIGIQRVKQGHAEKSMLEGHYAEMSVLLLPDWAARGGTGHVVGEGDGREYAMTNIRRALK